ncbi:MAG: 50S ribosomal protein L6 [Patescibacteria group bacterium]|mgnify:FL=1
MSKIGKKPIAIPTGVDIKIDGNSLVVKGPKGELKKLFPAGVSFVKEESNLKVAAENSAIWGLSRALAANMVTGVAQGFQKILEFTGVGYKAQVKGDMLELNLGFTHPISVKAPPAVTFKVEKNVITIEGPDKESVGHVAAEIRSHRPPEPYKGSGIKYRDEVIRRKAGKKAGATATA